MNLNESSEVTNELHNKDAEKISLISFRDKNGIKIYIKPNESETLVELIRELRNESVLDENKSIYLPGNIEKDVDKPIRHIKGPKILYLDKESYNNSSCTTLNDEISNIEDGIIRNTMERLQLDRENTIMLLKKYNFNTARLFSCLYNNSDQHIIQLIISRRTMSYTEEQRESLINLFKYSSSKLKVLQALESCKFDEEKAKNYLQNN